MEFKEGRLWLSSTLFRAFRLFLAMEPLCGQTLHQLLAERGKLPLERALRILRELGAALQYLHCFAIVHQDIKPSRVFFYHQPGNRSRAAVEVVKLMNFGLARDLTSDAKNDEHLPPKFWVSDYAAPETASGDVDTRSDQWSLAVLAHQLLTGRLPFAPRAPSVSGLTEEKSEPVLAPSTALPEPALAALTKGHA